VVSGGLVVVMAVVVKKWGVKVDERVDGLRCFVTVNKKKIVNLAMNP